MQGFSGHWWQSLFDDSIPSSHADEIRSAAHHARSIWRSCVGALTSLLSLSLSMAFRRRFPGDGVLFYVIMLALMTPGLPAQPRHVALLAVHGQGLRLAEPADRVRRARSHRHERRLGDCRSASSSWSRSGTATTSGSRRRRAISAPRAPRTFREVTLPLIWTGLFGAFLFGFTLSWNEYDRTALVIASGALTLPIQIFALTIGSVIRPDLYALGTATTHLHPRRRRDRARSLAVNRPAAPRAAPRVPLEVQVARGARRGRGTRAGPPGRARRG